MTVVKGMLHSLRKSHSPKLKINTQQLKSRVEQLETEQLRSRLELLESKMLNQVQQPPSPFKLTESNVKVSNLNQTKEEAVEHQQTEGNSFLSAINDRMNELEGKVTALSPVKGRSPIADRIEEEENNSVEEEEVENLLPLLKSTLMAQQAAQAQVQQQQAAAHVSRLSSPSPH